jgi:hypothetical protein
MAILKMIITRIKKSGFSLSLILLLVLLLQIRVLQAQPSQEYTIKAVFLYNFTQFVEWPESAFAEETSPLIIGILGKDPFGSSLDETVRGERVKNHPLVVKRFKTAAEITRCHILYININEKAQLKSILESLKVKNILTVGDVSNFASNGGMICFFTEKNKTRIRINIEAVKNSELTISSKLLRLADLVETQTN